MEEGWNLAPIVIPLVALLAGWAIGFFDSNMRTSKKIKQAEDSAQVAIKDAENKITEMQKKLDAAVENPIGTDDPGLMRIKHENGMLTLDLDGRRMNTSALTTDQRKRLVDMLNAMRPWLEGKPAAAPTQIPSPPPKPKPVADTRQAPPAPLPPQSTSRPRASAPDQSSPTKKKSDEPASPPTSIVGQIDQILQARIINTPLESRGISLTESITGGVNVYVGVQRYEAIDDVPDNEVKAAIRAAITEWENKYTPGI